MRRRSVLLAAGAVALGTQPGGRAFAAASAYRANSSNSSVRCARCRALRPR